MTSSKRPSLEEYEKLYGEEDGGLLWADAIVEWLIEIEKIKTEPCEGSTEKNELGISTTI